MASHTLPAPDIVQHAQTALTRLKPIHESIKRLNADIARQYALVDAYHAAYVALLRRDLLKHELADLDRQLAAAKAAVAAIHARRARPIDPQQAAREAELKARNRPAPEPVEVDTSGEDFQKVGVIAKQYGYHPQTIIRAADRLPKEMVKWTGTVRKHRTISRSGRQLIHSELSIDADAG